MKILPVSFQIVCLVIVAGCSAPLSTTKITADGVETTNSSKNILHMRRLPNGEMIIASNTKDGYSYSRTDAQGNIEVIGPGVTQVVTLNLTDMTINSSGGADVSVSGMELIRSEETGAPKILKIEGLSIKTSVPTQAQTERIKAEVEAAMAMSGDARVAYIEQLKTIDSVVGSIVERIVDILATF